MTRFWFPWAHKEEGEEVVGFGRRAVAAIMSCFSDCFHTTTNAAATSYSLLISSPDSMVTRDKDVLSSSDDLLRNGGEAEDKLLEEIDVKELEDEATFLKACGTILQTPDEIRKASRKWTAASAEREEEKSLTFKSWLPNASLEKSKVEKQHEEFPSPVEFCEEWVTWTGFSSDSPSSMAGQRNTRRDSTSSVQSSDVPNVVTPIVSDTSVNCKNKSVRFDCKSDTSTFSSKGSPSDGSSPDSERSASGGNFTLSKSSPYPTPLKLTDNMQTPGTVFPSYMKNIADGRTGRIRSQYVYSVLNPVNYPSQGKPLKDENSDPNHLIESLKLNDEVTLTSAPISNKAMKDLLIGQDMKDEASLSSWLKQQSENQEGINKLFVPISDENFHFGTSEDGSITEMVAAHSNGQVTSSISPIKNSIYKSTEDQEIGSHATPFEERLKEALSEEDFASPRKPIGETL